MQSECNLLSKVFLISENMNWLKKNKYPITYWSLFAIAYIMMVIYLPDHSHPGDMGHWERWSAFMMEEGFVNIYDYGIIYPTIFPCNYPPVILYFLYSFGKIIGTVEGISEHINYFKAFPLFFDFAGAFAIFFLIKRETKNLFLPLLLLLNIAYLYNSLFWGQVDSIPAILILLSLIFAIRSQVGLSMIFCVLALNTKLQTIIFVPLLGLVLLPDLLKSARKTTFSLGVTLFLQLIIVLPFLLAGTLPKLLYVVTNAVDQYTNISLNAYNFWHLVMSSNPLYGKDYQLWLFGITYKTWGLCLFTFSIILSLMPIILKLKHSFGQPFGKDQVHREMIFLSAFLIGLCFFFFNTQMHERYAHPILIMSFYFGLLSRNYWIYGIASLAYLLNLESVLKAFDLTFYDSFVFNKKFIALLFLTALVLGFVRLYSRLYFYLSKASPG